MMSLVGNVINLEKFDFTDEKTGRNIKGGYFNFFVPGDIEQGNSRLVGCQILKYSVDPSLVDSCPQLPGSFELKCKPYNKKLSNGQVVTSMKIIAAIPRAKNP